jgi:hypothetical protein
MFSQGLAAAGVSLALSAGASASLTVTPVALTNHDDVLGPGVGPGVHFGTGINGDLGSSSGSINLAGDIVFRAADDTSTGGNGQIEGVWFHSAALGTNTPIALTNWTIDFYQYGHSGFVFPIINNAGNTAWRYATNAVFGNNGSGPALTAATTAGWPGILMPDTGGATLNTLNFPAPLMNAVGDTLFIGSMTPNTGDPVVSITPTATANSYGVWSGAPGATHLRIRENDLYPGTTPADDLRIGSLASSLNYPSFNSSGQILVAAGLQGTVNVSTGSRTDGALLKYTPGTGLSVVARKGDAVPGASGAFYNDLGIQTAADMNNAGKVAFIAQLRDAAVGGVASGRAFFTDASGALTMVARTGNPMPPIAGANGAEFVGVNWGTVFDTALINHNGTVLFHNYGMTGTGVTQANGDAVFKMDASGTISKVVRMGDAAPAVSTTGGLVTFNSMQGSPAFNALGQVAFYCGLASPDGGVNGLTGNNFGLFAVDTHGVIQLIAQKTTAFTVAPGDVRTVASLGGINGSGGEDGRATSLNDAGVFAFSLTFTDGSSGVFTVRIPGAPACGTADFNCDGDVGTDSDISGFFACLSGNCPPSPCTSTADFNADGDIGTDADIEAFFRVLGGGHC